MAHEYWRAALPLMRTAYGDVCQYSSHWIPFDTGFASIEHFEPRDMEPALAYDWCNFRLVCGRLNGRRGVRGVTDPFQLPAGLYEIVFPSLLIRVSEGFSTYWTELANDTIRILGLNDESTCVKTRQAWYQAYKKGELDFDFLNRMAPFLAGEMQRSGEL